MSKKIRIVLIVAIAVVAIILLCVIGYFVIKNKKIDSTVGSTWGDSYYSFFRELRETENKEEYGLSADTTSINLEFIQVGQIENPAMIITYQEDDTDYIIICFIDSEGNVKHITSTQGAIEYLYNIDDDDYDWYLHTIDESTEKYLMIEDLINVSNGDTEELSGYVFAIDDDTKSSIKGNYSASITVSTLDEVDEIFISLDTDDSLKVSIDLESSDLKFREEFVRALEAYRTDEVLTEEMEQVVTEKLGEINAAKEEQKEKEAIEKAKLTNNNINSRIGENLKWFAAAYLGSSYGWPYVYDYEDVTDEVTLPDADEYMTIYEVVDAESIDNIKNSMAEYMSSDVIARLASSDDFSDGFEEYDGKLYLVTSGLREGNSIDYDKAEVISSDGTTSEILLENYNFIGNTKIENITVTVTYENGEYMITDYTVESAF